MKKTVLIGLIVLSIIMAATWTTEGTPIPALASDERCVTEIFTDVGVTTCGFSKEEAKDFKKSCKENPDVKCKVKKP
jgi:hypothetical protein